MSVPTWFELVLLSLATYRTWRLLALDTVLDPLRTRVYRYDPGLEPELQPGYRRRLDDFVGCGWCAGFWLAVGWWGAWLLWPRATLIAATPFALSALAGLASKLD